MIFSQNTNDIVNNFINNSNNIIKNNTKNINKLKLKLFVIFLCYKITSLDKKN